DLAELAGGDGLALAGHGHRLDGEQLAADLGPGETGDLADLALLLGDAVGVAPYADELVEVLGRHHDLALLLAGDQRLHHLAADLGHLALEAAHAGLAGVEAD